MAVSEGERDWREEYPEFYDLIYGDEPSPKREPIVIPQPVGELPTDLTTENEFEVGLLLHYRHEPHLGKHCPLCLIEFDRNGFQRKYGGAVVEADAMRERMDSVLIPLSYAATAGINTALSYFGSEELMMIFAGLGD